MHQSFFWEMFFFVSLFFFFWWQPQQDQHQTVFALHGRTERVKASAVSRSLPGAFVCLNFLSEPGSWGFFSRLDLTPETFLPVWKLKLWRERTSWLWAFCNWITGVPPPLSFFTRLQGNVVRFWRHVRTGPSWPLQGRVCLQESGMSVFGGACLRFGLVDLLQRVWARKSPVQRAATHQGATQGALL